MSQVEQMTLEQIIAAERETEAINWLNDNTGLRDCFCGRTGYRPLW